MVYNGRAYILKWMIWGGVKTPCFWVDTHIPNTIFQLDCNLCCQGDITPYLGRDDDFGADIITSLGVEKDNHRCHDVRFGLRLLGQVGTNQPEFLSGTGCNSDVV